jgi:hypothetical protein
MLAIAAMSSLEKIRWRRRRRVQQQRLRIQILRRGGGATIGKQTDFWH